MGWGYHHAWFPFGPIFCVLLIGFVAFRVFAFRRWRYSGCHHGWPGGREEADAILRRRLASGEIDAAEYERLKEILRK